ncbi:MAG TPA: hypothetical protein K8V27_09685 [Butyricicoccus pullicaecorum]|nr:hypothetical protein [Butyricicoccus pullicaecorum]
MSSEFVFRISPMDTAALMPQVSCALEAYNEQESRRKYPGTWRLVDRLRRVPKAPAEVRRKRRRRRTVLGLIDWLLGMLLLIPAVTDPAGLYVLLIAGTTGVACGMVVLWKYQRMLLGVLSMLSAFFLCVVGDGSPQEFGNLLPLGIGLAVLGLVCLFTGRRRRVTAYDRAAQKLLTRETDPQMMEQVRFTISKQEITMETLDQPDQKYTVPLTQLSYLIETEDLMLPIYAESVTVLQKRDLITGTLPELREFLADRLVQTSL